MKKSAIFLCIFFLLTPMPLAAKKLELPWTEKALKKAIAVGDKIIYAMSGTDKYGTEQKDDFCHEVKKIEGRIISYISYNMPADGSKPNITGDHEVFFPKDGTSPYFSYMRPKIKIINKEDITVPAGTFECTVVELKNMFGEVQKVWMINNLPGIYAKVTEENRIYSLKEVQKKK